MQLIPLSILVSFLWGVTPIMQKRILNRVSKETMLLVGGISSTIALIVLCIINMDNLKRDFKTIDALLIFEIVVAITVAVFFANIIFYKLLEKHDSYLVTALTYTSPVFTVVLAWLILKEQISWINGLGIGLMIIGVLLVVYKRK